jgi:hypothetical protein
VRCGPAAAASRQPAAARQRPAAVVGRVSARAAPPRPCACRAQVAPTKVRGTLGSLNQLMICLGILGALLVNVALPMDAWRNMFLVAVAPAIILFLGAAPLGKGRNCDSSCGTGSSTVLVPRLAQCRWCRSTPRLSSIPDRATAGPGAFARHAGLPREPCPPGQQGQAHRGRGGGAQAVGPRRREPAGRCAGRPRGARARFGVARRHTPFHAGPVARCTTFLPSPPFLPLLPPSHPAAPPAPPAAGDAKSSEASWSDLFKPGLRKGVLIGCMLFVFQQFSGINALIYFSSSVFKQVGGRGGRGRRVFWVREGAQGARGVLAGWRRLEVARSSPRRHSVALAAHCPPSTPHPPPSPPPPRRASRRARSRARPSARPTCWARSSQRASSSAPAASSCCSSRTAAWPPPCCSWPPASCCPRSRPTPVRREPGPARPPPASIARGRSSHAQASSRRQPNP